MQCCTDRGGWIILLIRGYQSGLQLEDALNSRTRGPTPLMLSCMAVEGVHDVASLKNSPCSYTTLLKH